MDLTEDRYSYALGDPGGLSKCTPLLHCNKRKSAPRSAACTGCVVMNWRKADLVPSILRVHPSPTSHGGNITNFRVRHISSGKGDSGMALVAKPETSQRLPFGLLFFLNIYFILRCVHVSPAICVPGTHGGRKTVSPGSGVRKGCEWSCG